MADTADMDDTVFEPVDLDRVADAVVEQIEGLIVSGVLEPGQKLPPERELAEALGVSRPKLREAFQALAARGLVEIRRSEGAFIRPLQGPALSEPMVALFARHRAAFLDFVEFRREQEGFAAHLAAQRATPADREILGLVIAEMEAARKAEDLDREAALDLRFHRSVVEASHNAIAVHVMRSVYALMGERGFYDRGVLYRQPGGGARLLEQHKAIAEAILAGDSEAAVAASERHLDHLERVHRLSEDEDRRASVARKRRSLADLALGQRLRRRR